ncbi:ead/Ea22-like family protein [Escherichia coli]
MSKIDYQALRAKAEKATCGVWSLEYGESRFDCDDALIHREVVGYLPICRIEGAHPESGFDEDFQMEQQANAEFIAAANPSTVLALLDELEAAEERYEDMLRQARSFREAHDSASEVIRKLERNKPTVTLPTTRLWAGNVACYEECEIREILRAAGIRIKGE